MTKRAAADVLQKPDRFYTKVAKNAKELTSSNFSFADLATFV
jgi:hypothetical protein